MVFKKEVKKPEAPVVEVIKAPEGPTCACGKPLAPGQTYVCKDHIRIN